MKGASAAPLSWETSDGRSGSAPDAGSVIGQHSDSHVPSAEFNDTAANASCSSTSWGAHSDTQAANTHIKQSGRQSDNDLVMVERAANICGIIPISG